MEARIEAVPLDDEAWDRFAKRTGGAAAACFQCGVCTATCPWGLVRETPPSVRHLIRAAQLGRPNANEAAWLCTACGECEQACPRQVPIAEVFRGLRGLLWERREVPEGLPSVLWSMHWNRNPWSQPPSQRMRWAEGLDLPPFDPQAHEIVLYIGCTASYEPRAQKVARAVIRLLRAANVAFGVLGETEPCCGEAALSLGHRAYFEDISRTTAATLAERGVRRLVTISPHAFDVFRHHYPPGVLETTHYVAYLARLAQEGRLPLERALPKRITYHDPCLLGRKDQSYDAPRSLLEAIPELSLVEMEHHRENALCCGGGGGRMWMETPRGERFADVRIQEALATDSDFVVTACPFCIVMLEDSLRGMADQRMKVVDLGELLTLAIPDEAILA